MIINEWKELRVICEAPNGIPAANISWFLVNQTDDYGDDYILHHSIRNVIANTDKTYTSENTLTFNVSRENQGIEMYCNASNDENHVVSSEMIRLEVRYLPKQAVNINNQQDYGTFSMIRNSGTEQSLQCSVYGGNPFANLSWSCYNGTQTDMNTPSSAVSNVSWFAGDFNDAICTCNASHLIGWTKTQAVAINVLFTPTLIKCTVGNRTLFSGILNVTLCSNVTLTCESLGNPPPTNYTWIWPYHNITTGHLLSFNNIQRWFEGNYTLLVENVMDPSIGPTVTGYANATFDVHVLYHPDTPTFRFEPHVNNLTINSLSVIRNEQIRIACISDGNPPPSYNWSTGQNVQIINYTAPNSDTNLTCEVSNTLYPTGASSKHAAVKSILEIKVLFPPETPVIVINSRCLNKQTLKQNVIQILEHDKMSVECFADGKPEPTYQWTNCSQSYKFDILNVSKEDKGTYVCNASNIMNQTYGDTVVGRNDSSFDLDILYPPKITTLNTSVEVLEGVNYSLNCEAEPGNPKNTSYYWTSTTQPDISGQNLIIKNISRADEGIFTCSAHNIMKPTGCTAMDGSDVKNVTIDVQYKASIITFTAMNTTNTTVQHGDVVTFACEVDSDPPADISILSNNGSTLKNIKGNNMFNYTKNSSCLEDIGQFSCISENKHNRNQPDIRTITLDVECSPFYRPNYFQNTTISTRPGNFVVLNFSVFSNPPPTQFTWTNISNSMQLPIHTTTSDRVIINTTADDMSSSLIITRVEPWDFGNYSVEVENEIGSMIETFLIVVEVPSTSPGPPIINVSPDEQTNTNTIGAVIGGSVGAITAVVITAVVVIVFVYRKMKGTANYNNNNLQLLQDTRHESGKMETSFDKVLPTNDDAPMNEEEKNIYGNIQTNDAFGNTFTIKTLRDTIRQLKLDPLPLFKEFYSLQMGLKYDTKHALKKNNVAKNRYRSVYPYDASRVVLPFLRGDLESDFINASYIDGYCKPRKYIAAQGPLENTISDTWRMIYSEDVKVIVMVTNLIETGKRKCFQYWPDDRATYGECNVKLDQVEEYADFVVRQITYSMEGTRFERQLIQFHYTSWPDKNVPATALSLVQFWRKVRQSEFVENTPWMVHCSAGVGRTGTFIALDYLFDQGKVDGKLNVPETVNLLREQRISMVQTKEQYLYLHEAITELLSPVGQIFTPENSLRLRSTATEESKLKKEFKVITNSIVSVKTDFEENDSDLKRMPDGLLPENICKSIDQTVIPDDLFRPLISTGNDFINAVYIPTYRDAEKYIVTQYPLQNTVLDFIRLLWDHSIEDVVLLDVGDEKLHCYWPNNKSPLCIGPFVISLLSVDEGNNCTNRRIDISLAERRQNKQTVVHQFTAWPGYLNLCEPKPLTDFLQTISRFAGPVVVQCHDGYSRSGLFAALLSIVDRIKTDKEVAIADTVRVVKHRRQAAITDVEQYQFCHEVVFEYLKGRENQTEEKENQEYVNMTFPKFL
ncbi:hemicentin-1-like isoform X2 [Mya arenaria]|nr:hemicentin-1-like isoform X2 [Mya arenaria]